MFTAGPGFFNRAVSGSGDPYFAFVKSLNHFDGSNGSTTITDQISGTTWSVSGSAQLSNAHVKFGTTALSLPGSSYVPSGNTAALWKPFTDGVAAWTIEGFFYPTTVSGPLIVFDCGAVGTDTTGVALNINGSAQVDFLWARSTSGTYCARITGGTVSANAWHYIKIYYNPSASTGTKLQVWLDGSMIGQADPSSPSSGNPSSTMNFGRYVNGNSLFFQGYLDEFRMTAGVARNADNTVPTAPFPDS